MGDSIWSRKMGCCNLCGRSKKETKDFNYYSTTALKKISSFPFPSKEVKPLNWRRSTSFSLPIRPCFTGTIDSKSLRVYLTVAPACPVCNGWYVVHLFPMGKNKLQLSARYPDMLLSSYLDTAALMENSHQTDSDARLSGLQCSAVFSSRILVGKTRLRQLRLRFAGLL